jgi:hypothetical protein
MGAVGPLLGKNSVLDHMMTMKFRRKLTFKRKRAI